MRFDSMMQNVVTADSVSNTVYTGDGTEAV